MSAFYLIKKDGMGGEMKTIDISGFGGSYEAACQKMLFNGLKFLKDKPNFDWEGYKTYRGVYGLCTAETAEAKELDDALLEGLSDATRAMHQAVIGHLACIHKHGHDALIVEAQRQGRELYEMPIEEER